MSGTCNFGLCSRSSRRALSSVVISINCRRRQRRLPRPLPPLPAPPLPTTVPGVLSVAMPIDTFDAANAAFGLLPFGYHGGGHTEDGHAGWDIEIAHRRASACCGDRYRHQRGARSDLARFEPQSCSSMLSARTFIARTIRTSPASPLKSSSMQAVVVGQTIGTVARSRVIGNASITYAMTHFQLDDLEFHREVANPKAVTPNPSSARRRSRCSIASGARRSISMSSSSLLRPTRVKRRLPCAPGPALAATVRRGFALRAGVMRIPTNCWPNWNGDRSRRRGAAPVGQAGHDRFDLPTATRLGVYDIVSNEMRMAAATAGLPRPPDLSGALDLSNAEVIADGIPDSTCGGVGDGHRRHRHRAVAPSRDDRRSDGAAHDQ